MRKPSVQSLIPHRIESGEAGCADIDSTDMYLLSLVDGRIKLGELCDVMPCVRDETILRIHKLARCALVRLPGVEGPELQQPVAQLDHKPAAPAREAEAGRAVKVPQLLSPLARASVIDKLKPMQDLFAQLEDLDYARVLGVSPDASLQTIRDAYFRLWVFSDRGIGAPQPSQPLDGFDLNTTRVSKLPPSATAPVEDEPNPPVAPSHHERPYPFAGSKRISQTRLRGDITRPLGDLGTAARPGSASLTQPPIPTLDAAPGLERTLRTRALRAEVNKEWATAASLWRRASNIEPECGTAALHAAKCLLQAGDARLACHYGREAVRIDPSQVHARQILADSYDALGLPQSAKNERSTLRLLCGVDRKATR